ncbi:MAG: glutamyl-tRNA reductase [Alphaproteobacteria bacterium]
MTAAGLFVVGANHRSSSAALRDRLAFDAAAVPALHERLSAAGVGQAILLSTCDRIEVQGADAAPDRAAAAVRELLCRLSGLPQGESIGQFYTLFGEAALRHIFAVAASLDSQIPGEPQVLGQVKDAHRLSQDCRMMGSMLDRALQAAYAVAKKVRSETDIAIRPVSIASSAVQVARDVQGDLSRRSALVIGLGEMGELVLRQLAAAGLDRHVMSGASARAEAFARREGLAFCAYDRLEAGVSDADIVVTAQGSGGYALTASAVEAALRRRRRRPVVIFDMGIPADVEPAVNDLDGAFLFTADDLEAAALQGRSAREAAAEAAWVIVDAAVAAWHRDRAEREAVPDLVQLRSRFEAMRADILAANPTADAAEATRLLMNRILHEPAQALKAMASDGALDRPDSARMLLHRLFGMTDDDEKERVP